MANDGQATSRFLRAAPAMRMLSAVPLRGPVQGHPMMGLAGALQRFIGPPVQPPGGAYTPGAVPTPPGVQPYGDMGSIDPAALQAMLDRLRRLFAGTTTPGMQQQYVGPPVHSDLPQSVGMLAALMGASRHLPM